MVQYSSGPPLVLADAFHLRQHPCSGPSSVPSAPLTPFLLRVLPQEVTHTQIPTSDSASRKRDPRQAEFQHSLLPVLTAQIQNQPRIEGKPQLSNTYRHHGNKYKGVKEVESLKK